MQRKEKVQKLIEWFSAAAVRHAEAMDDLRAEEAARQVERLDAYFAAVMREDGLDLFLTLLEKEDPSVSGMAAVYAMRNAPQRCKAVLAGIAGQPGLLGFRAKAALDLWEAGEWPR